MLGGFLGHCQMNDKVTEESIQSLDRQLQAMKATGTYDQWRENLRKEAAAFEASPQGRLARLFRNIQFLWWRLTGRV